MKKIGFVDYYLNEWHANKYPAWIKEISARKGLDYKVCYAYGEIAAPHDGKTSADWCAENGIEECRTIDELCEKSDFIIILSPDNAEKHLQYAEAVLRYKKPTYVDKTFAPDVGQAKKIFDISEKFCCPICSSSALRFADELKGLKEVENMISIGGGLTYDIYAIHQIEMIVRLMGSDVKRIMATQNTKSINLTMEYSDGRRASLIQNVYCSKMPFILLTEHSNTRETRYTVIQSDFFVNFIDALLDFFETGIKVAQKQETLAVIGLIESGKRALDRPDSWIDVNSY